MDTFLQDLRFAVRSLTKSRGTSTIAAACLALGIGANTAIFSVVRTVLLESLPYRDASRIVRIYETGIFNGKRGLGSVSVPNFLDWRAQNDAFEAIAAYSSSSADLVGNGQPERVRAVNATANLFAILGTKPELGRTFALDEDEPGRAPVVVLSDGFWRRRFGSDQAILGKQISLNNTLHTVVGVMPPSFDFPIQAIHTDVWRPLVLATSADQQRGNHWMSVVGRLKPGMDSASATARMMAITKRIAAEHPDDMRERGVSVNTMNGVVVGKVRTPLLMLLGAVAVVLLVACANVANLLLARASGRRREVAIRTALGADRGRLIRQFLTESVLLALAGGTAGIAIAHWGLEGILAYAAGSLPRTDVIRIDLSVLAFAATVSVLTGLVFGLVPALRASRIDLRQDLNESAGRAGTSRQHHRTLDSLIVAEIALSLVLLVGAGLLVRGFVALTSVDPGLRAENVLTFHVASPTGQFSDSVRYTQFYGPVLERIRNLPGVQSAGLTSLLPIQASGWNGLFSIVGRPEEKDPSRATFAEYRVVSSNYFKSLGVRLVKGREFSDQDSYDAPQVVIVNEEFVRRYFPNEEPIGKQINAWKPMPSTIVGVANSVRQVSLDQPPAPEVYVAAAQTPRNIGDVTYVVSTKGTPELLVSAVREAVRSVAPNQPIYVVKSMEQVISDSLQSRKLTLSLLAIFAILAVVLSAAGVYGVMSYGVSQRRREIGIRMALGARGGEVTSMVLRDAAKLAGIGVTIGLLGASLLTRILTGMVYGVGTRDPATFAAVAGLIGAVAVGASLIPALRAARVDPLTAMRAE
jgi:predicted permease